jgi:hypothetical protein
MGSNPLEQKRAIAKNKISPDTKYTIITRLGKSSSEEQRQRLLRDMELLAKINGEWEPIETSQYTDCYQTKNKRYKYCCSLGLEEIVHIENLEVRYA